MEEYINKIEKHVDRIHRVTWDVSKDFSASNNTHVGTVQVFTYTNEPRVYKGEGKTFIEDSRESAKQKILDFVNGFRTEQCYFPIKNILK